MAVTAFERKNLPWGQSRGFPTTKRELKPKPSSRKGKASKRHEFVKNVVAEVAGQAPYERRLIELLRNGQDKKARKMAKNRLGTLKRGKRKVDHLTNVIAEQRRTGAH